MREGDFLNNKYNFNQTSSITLILFGLAVWAAFSIYQPFLLPISVATLLVMATSNMTAYLVHKLHSNTLGTLAATVVMFVLMVAPIIYIATTGVAYASHLDQATIHHIVAKIKEFTHDIPYLSGWVDEYLQSDKITGYIKDATLYVTKMGGAGLGFLKEVGLVITFYAIVNYYSERFFVMIQSLLPVSLTRSEKMISEVASTMEVVFYSIVVTAIFEGFLFGIFISYFGFNGLVFGVIYGFASLIPIVGGAIVWVPLSLYAWSEMDNQTALTIALYSIIVISVIADTFIKPIIIKVMKEDLLHNTTSINEFVIFFSILAGMGSYGFWGMILGPAITTFLFATAKIYIEYNQTHRSDKAIEER
jgi:predicted PurR-regulated permease PerM